MLGTMMDKRGQNLGDGSGKAVQTKDRLAQPCRVSLS